MFEKYGEDPQKNIETCFRVISDLAKHQQDELAFQDYQKKFTKGPSGNPTFLFDSVKLELMELRRDITDLSVAVWWLMQENSKKFQKMEQQLWTATNLLTFLFQKFAEDHPQKVN